MSNDTKENVNQWAFCAITGFEPHMPFFSASVDGWRDVSADLLLEFATSQVDEYLPANVSRLGFSASRVVDAVIKVRSASGDNDWRHVYASLA